MKNLDAFPIMDWVNDIGHVYAIVNKMNGKKYIGATTDIRNRVSGHLSALRRGTHFSKTLQSDFMLFGEDAFSVELLAKAPYGRKGYLKLKDKAELHKIESALIQQHQPEYNTKVPCSRAQIDEIKKTIAA